MTDITGVLKNWRHCEGCFGRPQSHYHGELHEDAKRRFGEGEEVRTSVVVSGPDPSGIIRTQNSIYRLEPYPNPAQHLKR